MEKLLAKMKVGSVTDFGNDNFEANLTAVQGDSEENKTYSMYTPRAEAKLHITNPKAIGFFEAGDEYIVEFSKVEVKHDDKIFNAPGIGSSMKLKSLLDVTTEEEYVSLKKLKKGQQTPVVVSGKVFYFMRTL